MLVACITTTEDFLANFTNLSPMTVSPAAVASRVDTVDDDFRISRVIENPEVMRRC